MQITIDKEVMCGKSAIAEQQNKANLHGLFIKRGVVGQDSNLVVPGLQRSDRIGILSLEESPHLPARSILGRFADVEFELPAARVAGALAPELEGADLVDVRVQADGDDLAPGALFGGKGRFQGGELLDFLGVPTVEDGAHGVVAAGRGAEEAEDGRLADDQAKLGAGDVGLLTPQMPLLKEDDADRPG